MKWGKSRESWLGVIITAVLCLGFLYWWFRPEPRPWRQESASQLVTRAMSEPPPASRVERQVLDFDLMEVSICQARGGMLDEATAVVKHVGDPVIRTHCVRAVAQTFLHSDPQNFGRVLGIADLISDEAQRALVRQELLVSLAVLGFPHAAMPEAKTARQKAALARNIAATDDDGQEKARELLAAAEKELPSLSPAEAAAARIEIAWTRVNLTFTDGPENAIAAVKELPAVEQTELWKALTGWCNGREDKQSTVPLVIKQVADPVLRRRLEIESLLSDVKVRPAEAIIAECRAEAGAATSAAAKVGSLLAVADAQRNSEETAAAEATLQQVHRLATAMTDRPERCRILIELTRKFSDALLFPHALACLEEAIKTIADVHPDTARIPLLVLAADESFKQANEPQAAQLLDEAMRIVKSAPATNGPPLDGATLQSLAVAIVHRGDWPGGLSLIDQIDGDGPRRAALEAAAQTVSEDIISINPGESLRGAPVDGIRERIAGDQAQAATVVARLPAGYARARAWLAMAKGLLSAPMNLSDYMATDTQPQEDPVITETPHEPPLPDNEKPAPPK